MIKKIVPSALNNAAPDKGGPVARESAAGDGEPTVSGTKEGKQKQNSFGEMLQSAQKGSGRPSATDAEAAENKEESLLESEAAPGADNETGEPTPTAGKQDERPDTMNEKGNGQSSNVPTNGDRVPEEANQEGIPVEEDSSQRIAGELSATGGFSGIGDGAAPGGENEGQHRGTEQKVHIPDQTVGDTSEKEGGALNSRAGDGEKAVTPGITTGSNILAGEAAAPGKPPGDVNTMAKEVASGSGATATATEGAIPAATTTGNNPPETSTAFTQAEQASSTGNQQVPEEVKNALEKPADSNKNGSGVGNPELAATGKSRAPAEYLGKKLAPGQRLKHQLSTAGAVASTESGPVAGTNGDNEGNEEVTRASSPGQLFRGRGMQPLDGQPVMQGIQAEQVRKNEGKRRPFNFSGGGENSSGSGEGSSTNRENTPRINGQQLRAYLSSSKPAGISSAGTFPGSPEATPAMNFNSFDENRGWDLQGVELTEDSETTTSTGASNNGQFRLGDLPVNNLTLRRNILPGLTQTVSKAAGGTKTAPETWQKHNFVLEDGKEIHLSARRTEGVLQLKVGSLHGEVNKLLQQHQQEIRQHLEQECNLEIDLQFENDDQQGLPDLFGDPSSTGSQSSSPGKSSGGKTPPQQAEQITLKAVRQFGYNSKEWMA